MEEKRTPSTGQDQRAENNSKTENSLHNSIRHTSCQSAPLGNSSKSHDIQTHLIDGTDSTGKIHRVACFMLVAEKGGC